MSSITNPESFPPEQIKLVIEELANLFESAEADGQATMILQSDVGSKFHRRVKTAAAALGLDLSGAKYDIVPLTQVTE